MTIIMETVTMGNIIIIVKKQLTVDGVNYIDNQVGVSITNFIGFKFRSYLLIKSWDPDLSSYLVGSIISDINFNFDCQLMFQAKEKYLYSDS